MMQFVLTFMIVQSFLFINNGVSANLCEVKNCQRVTNEQYFGLDITSNPIMVDIGICNTTYVNEENCTLAKKSGNCVPTCEPESYDMEEHNHRHGGPIDVGIVRTCRPIMPPECQNESCKRISKILHFFPNSKYQTRVDVGDCVGGCNDDDNGCMATRSESKSIEGPNGAITVDVVKTCGCAHKGCYKVDHFKSVYNYNFTNGNETNRNDLVKEEKLINIGKCVGECEGITYGGRCYPSDDACFLFIGAKPAKCVPTQTFTETYVDKNNEVQIVSAISECSCGRA